MLKSFKYALEGAVTSLRTGRNLKVMLACFVIVLTLSVLLGLSGLEWAVVLLCCAGVISLEMLNSAIETVINIVSPGISPLAKKAKDVAAGAVLVFSILTAAIGLIIFIPHIAALFV